MINLGDEMDSNIWLKNNQPIEDFLNLSQNEVHYLVYETFGGKSIINFRDDIDNITLDQIPLFRIAEEYLRIIERNNFIKLTPLGALPKKVLVELYDKRLLLDEQIESGLVKLNREIDCMSIMSARITLELAGVVKKVHGKLTLTKKGTSLIKHSNRVQLFKAFFIAFTDKFDWCSNDGYQNKAAGQLAWAYSMFMLNKFGDQKQTIDLYAFKYLRAFPALIAYFGNNYATPELQFFRCYGVRTFERFLLWFGFVTVEQHRKYLEFDTDEFAITQVVRKIFNFDEV